jgi:hypothetical protein
MSTRCLLVCCIGFAVLSYGVAWKAAPIPGVSVADYRKAGGRPVDADAAMNSPGVYAWKLFMNINRPGTAVRSGNRGKPARGKGLGDPGDTIWQSWKDVKEVYLPGGADPKSFDSPPFPGYQRGEVPKALMLAAATAGLNPLTIRPAQLRGSALVQRPDLQRLLRQVRAKPDDESEARMNRATFDFIRRNKLYSRAGQEAYWRTNVPMVFPKDSIEVKASWKNIGPATPQNANLKRYHYVKDGKDAFGLVALHIITKDVPDWYWCTFEHQDNREPLSSDFYSADIDPQKNREFVRLPGSKGPIPKLIKNTKWRFYRLRGTQTAYNFSGGVPNLLDNQVIEQGFVFPSSCMSCHARAALSSTGAIPLNSATLGLTPRAEAPPPSFTGPSGPPDPAFFGDQSSSSRLLQQDFVWSLFRAQ